MSPSHLPPGSATGSDRNPTSSSHSQSSQSSAAASCLRSSWSSLSSATWVSTGTIFERGSKSKRWCKRPSNRHKYSDKSMQPERDAMKKRPTLLYRREEDNTKKTPRVILSKRKVLLNSLGNLCPLKSRNHRMKNERKTERSVSFKQAN